MKKLSFVVPCYNEEKNIKLFYNDLEKSFRNIKIELELIFINDGSKDNTLLELNKILKSSNIKIKIINFSRNFGKEASIYAGLKNTTGDYVVLIDADMQQPPHLVIDMLKIIEKNNNIDIVTYFQEDRIENKIISFLKKYFYTFFGKITNIDFKNGASDFRLFKRNVADVIIEMSEHNRFSKGIFAWIGFENYYLPYVPDKRMNGKTSWNIKSLLKYAFSGIISFSKLHKLIIKFGVLNIICSIIWLIFALIFANESIILHYIFIFILFMFGCNYILIGILGEYVYRSYDETRNRPLYIIKEVKTNEKNI